MHKKVCVVVCVMSVCAALICPDGNMCEEGNTCCQKPSGGYGCCPLPNAECCSDHLHCCYEGTWCDLVHFKCVNKTHTLDWVKRVPAQQSSLPRAVVCPDQESECPDDTTCCQMPSGNWGCCPMPNAVCCEDKRHCCPQSTTCDLAHSRCVSPTLGSTPLWRKLPARPRAREKTRAVQCADKFSKCPDDTTCCPLGNGSYGCCPLPKAVCCSDHMHCCPEGMSCDLIHSTCNSANETKPWATKIQPVFHPKTTVRSVPCNKSVVCESGSTCCKREDGDWACCPLPEAVCCEDHIHCCPHNTVCDLSEGMCDDSADPLTSVDWVEKVPAFLIVPQPLNQKCDSSTSCPDGATCCKMVSAAWGCCPLPQAVCCEDHLHCCPNNTVCNVAASTCDSITDEGPHLAIPWVTKMPAPSLLAQTDQCDDTYLCPGGTTCCRQKSGAWACCPLPQAVCCDDLQHCCPQGYTCDIAQESCEHPSLPSMPWVNKRPALSMTQHSDAIANASSSEAASVVQHEHWCDKHTSCPRDNTCCYMTKFSKWGCCPLPQAVCCGDGDHCCPRGYTCDEKKPTCIIGHLEIPWFSKKEAKKTQGSEIAFSDVKCDPKTSCAEGSTCCRLSTGQWGCCPLLKAVCCEDHKHCCPQGYTCDLQTGTCVKPSDPRAVTHLLMHADGPEGVVCDVTSRCSKTETCCQISDTEWACCPFKQAVCCKDMKHCCPMGYACDTKTKGCTRVPSLTWWDNSL
ncbi:granulin b [Electrophorus electricus]|uniref:Granulins domain-containing protein n=1 Tax=Electrophorus electricus TaxID=8005 RepID=A0A4W4DQZ4_ELEEL|nr:granulin b [Electrophorus electricus]